MDSRSAGVVVSQMRVLLGAGTVAGLADGELLGRFAARRDAAAFEALVTRHGPMVLRVCRDVVGNRHDAEDAFQAVFLVLARKARAIREPDLVGHWLYGVALRTAREARARHARRLRREAREAAMRHPRSGDGGVADPIRREEAVALHEEVGRLPARYRAPVVLCYFEGLTHAEAAGRLRSTTSTIGVRLMRARDLLRARLTRRGLAPALVLLAAPPCADAASLAVPPELVHAALRTAIETGMAGAAGALAARVMTSMSLAKAKAVLAVSLSIALAAAVAGGFVQALPKTSALAASALPQSSADKATPSDGETPVDQDRAKPAETRPVLDFGVVEARSGKPVPGASVALYHGRETRFKTDAQGRCLIPLPTDLADQDGFMISAWKDGFTPLRPDFSGRDVREGKARSYTLNVEPAAPLGGFVRDEQNRPIAGAKVKVRFFESRLRDQGRPPIVFDMDEWFTTDAEGRWERRLLPETSDNDPLSTVSTWITHPDFVSDAGRPRWLSRSLLVLRGRRAIMVMTSGVPVSGSVVDPDDHPVAGARVVLAWSEEWGERYVTTSDARGAFRFAHARPGHSSLTAVAPGFGPELVPIEAKADLKPTTIRLGPGRTIRGRVVDSQDRPVAGALVHAETWRLFRSLDWNAKTDAEGCFVWEHAPKDFVDLATSASRLHQPARARVSAFQTDVIVTLPR